MVDILEEFCTLRAVSSRDAEQSKLQTYGTRVVPSHPLMLLLAAFSSVTKWGLTADSMVLFASLMVEAGVSLGYVIRTCRSGEREVTPNVEAARSRDRMVSFIAPARRSEEG